MNSIYKTTLCVIAAVSFNLHANALASPSPSTSISVQQHAEYQAVDRTMQALMQAFEQGSQTQALQVVLPDAIVLGYSNKQQKVVSEQALEWAKGFEPAADEADRHRQYQILDITDTGAVVKVTLDYPLWLGVDYLAMSKVDGRWRVVSKSWSGTRKDSK